VLATVCVRCVTVARFFSWPAAPVVVCSSEIFSAKTISDLIADDFATLGTSRGFMSTELSTFDASLSTLSSLV